MSSAPRRFRHRLRVRFGECDPQARVFNANYLLYADVALTEFLREATGSYDHLGEAGYDLALAECTVRFLAPARVDDELLLTVSPQAPGRTSLQLDFQIECEGRELATVGARYVCIERPGQRKAPWPDWLRTAVSPYLLN